MTELKHAGRGIQWPTVAILLAGFAALSTVHAYFVVPGILRTASLEARTIFREGMQDHRREADGRAEANFQILSAKMDTMLVELNAVKERLDRVERQTDGR